MSLSRTDGIHNPRRNRAVVLLEVVLSLALFAAAAGAVVGAFNSCTKAVQDIGLQNRCADLAVTAFSEIQMNLSEVAEEGPNAFDAPNEDWSWRTMISESSLVESPLRHVRLTVSNASEHVELSFNCLLLNGSSSDSGDD